MSEIVEVAKDPQPNNAEARPAPKIEAPDWWKKLTPAGRDTYLRNHPKSKLDAFLRQELKSYLERHPQDRKRLRGVIKDITNDPEKALKGDFDKLDEAAKSKKIPKKEKKIIVDAINKTNKTKKSRNILKAVVAAMTIAGVLTVGGAILASGGLPYLIIGPRLVKDTVGLVKDINQRIHEGQDAVKATLGAVSSTVKRAVTDPHMIAAALMLQQQRNRKRNNDDEDTKQKVTSAKKGKVTNKRQQKPQKSTKQPQPKQKPHNPNVVS